MGGVLLVSLGDVLARTPLFLHEAPPEFQLTLALTLKKAAANLKNHGVDFREAATVFDDRLSTTFPDHDHSFSEQRSLTIGMSAQGRTLVVSHTEIGDEIGLINARETTRRERRFYEEGE